METEDGGIIGSRVPRKEDKKFLTVGGTYVDDLRLEGAAWIVFVRSHVAHARIRSCDLGTARSAPGVIDVVDSSILELPVCAARFTLPQAMARPPLADRVVRFVGEPIAVVAAESRAQAVDAAELVVVDYDPITVVVDPEEAAEDETLLFPDAGTNVALDFGDDLDDALFDGCEVVVRQRIVNQRVAPCPMEVRTAAASFGSDGRLTFFASSQSAFRVQADLARALGLDKSMVHVIAPDVGGAFGAKISPYPDELVVAAMARRLSRPVRWTETRSESMVGLGHGRGQIQHVTMGGDRRGRVTAYRLEVLADAGAYPVLGTVLPTVTHLMAPGNYDIDRVEFHGRSVVTNTVPTTAYRGAGRPEATAAIERAMDLFAQEIGMDPAELRRKNLIRSEQLPFTTKTGATYDSGDYLEALDLVCRASGYGTLRAEQSERRRRGARDQLGLGISVYVEATNGVPGTEFSSVEIREDGKAVVKTGTSSHGQGHATAWSMLVAGSLGLSIDDVEFVQSDTDLVATGVGTSGSRSLQSGGVATRKAVAKAVEMAKEVAAHLLEASPEDLVIDPKGGGLHVAGAPVAFKSWGELARAATKAGTPLLAEIYYDNPGPTFPFGAHLAVVEVDTETGKVTLQRLVAVDDAGIIIAPMLARGQVHGGVAQGVAQALFEEFRYDVDGNPLTGNLADYTFVSAPELPTFECFSMETPTANNELGVKGIGESGIIGSTPATQNAVVDAVAHLGVRHIDMPATPERVWNAIEAATAQ